MSTAVARIRPSDLDALWARSEPDLELDDDGRVRPIATEQAGSSRGSAIASAAPVALGMLVSSIASVNRWD